ncbi:hypothetical protein CWE12_10295 [Aliidiomarina sedimenti]|uniref:Uncharacterized protein n=1 Tax=Aliidiomarina sedimenti TaxID=1933879 RepID=A0ABY0BY13_9GAMM|nr:hypothetical protein [Aliidiomarina sedimenti]RUO29360.1 hypothetical protein CWE12_10295 [Aliidiomarina sedimenti]
MRSWRPAYLPFITFALLLSQSGCAQSQDEPEQVTQTTASPQSADEEPSQQTSSPDDDDMMLDSVQRGVQASVDATARWFDGFFGDSRTFDDSDYDSQGRISLAPQWTEYEGWRVRSSLRVKVDLPIAENRFSAFIGRVDTDDYVVGDDAERRASVLRNINGDSEWLVGLGFNPSQGEENRFNVSAGIRGGLNADPYTEARYLYQKRITNNAQFRTRSAAFWRDSDGFGFAQRVDYEHTWGPKWLLRLANEATYAERVEGIRLRNSAALYHLYDEEKAVAFEITYAGETKAEVQHKDITTRFIHRQSWLRDWFYVEKWVGMHWPKEFPEEERERAWMLGIEFELWYGR